METIVEAPVESHQSAEAGRPLGWHWLLDAEGCEVPACADMGLMERVLLGASEALGLTRVGEPQLYSQPGPEPIAAGLILLAESHLSVHVRPAAGIIHVDLFSCKRFDSELALKCFQEAYGFKRWRQQSFERGARSGGEQGQREGTL